MSFLTDEEIHERLKNGMDVNALLTDEDNEGTTLLMHVHSADLARELIAAGADVNAKDNDNETAMDVAKNNEIK